MTTTTPDAVRAGSMLREVRQALGATQAEAAVRLGVPRTTLGRLERGETFPRDPRVSHASVGYGRWIAQRAHA